MLLTLGADFQPKPSLFAGAIFVSLCGNFFQSALFLALFTQNLGPAFAPTHPCVPKSAALQQGHPASQTTLRDSDHGFRRCGCHNDSPQQGVEADAYWAVRMSSLGPRSRRAPSGKRMTRVLPELAFQRGEQAGTPAKGYGSTLAIRRSARDDEMEGVTLVSPLSTDGCLLELHKHPQVQSLPPQGRILCVHGSRAGEGRRRLSHFA